jgi:Uma2 family endonuclease
MSVVESSPPIVSEPAWEIATLFPDQGQWSEADYLSLTDNSRHMVELVEGRVEVLPMPSLAHQRIVNFVAKLIEAFVLAHGLGEVLQSPVRVRLGSRKFREPDIVFVRNDAVDPENDRFYESADLVVEVVSDDPKDRRRDLDEKREAYQQAGVREYWIIDPRELRITVLNLSDGRYVVYSEGGVGMRVRSALLEGFELEVGPVFEAAKFQRRK